MAVAGLHNVSVCDSAYFGGASSPASIRWGDRDRLSTRTSSILKMWLELEGEHAMSHTNISLGMQQMQTGTSDSGVLSSQESKNGTCSFETVTTDDNGSQLCSRSLSGSDDGHEDSNSFCSDQCNDLGEIERERVRQIFHEWKNRGVKCRSPSDSHKNRSRAQFLGQSECERVRSIREWVQNGQQRGAYGCASHEGVTQGRSKGERARDGQLVSHCVVGERRNIRKLCGRQALHDMLSRVQREREKEILSVSERRQVSDFAHRNRIQSLLKGRFLMNRRLIQEERPTCAALTPLCKLGLLRKRNTVSDLREGFLSKLNHGLAGGRVQSDATYHDDNVDLKNQHRNSSNNPEVQWETDSLSDSGNSQVEISNRQNTACCCVTERNPKECGAPMVTKAFIISGKGEGDHETSLFEHIRDWHSRANGTLESWLDKNKGAWSGGVSADKRRTLKTNFLEAHEVKSESSSQCTETHDDHEVDGLLSHDLEECITSEATSREENDREQFTGGEFSAWEHVGVERIMWQDTGSERYHESIMDTISEQNHTLESVPLDSLQEANATCTWLDVEYGQEAGAAQMSDSFYLSNEESITSMEIRQLQNRRRVSTLLRSGFRESLNQLIQSFVQRQNDASTEWELYEFSSSHASLGQEQEPQCNLDDGVQPSRDQELLQENCQYHHPCQRIENPWEVINELRNGMAMLHEKMNNMQNILETCMDMQRELQRSVASTLFCCLPFRT